ncbi:MAG: hypothetical protein J7K87_03275 [Candidatus Aenigmarchaeota archaeon]|nr:hypothetical protein [Candidatus Aenigmarchaeota archaeon]
MMEEEIENLKIYINEKLIDYEDDRPEDGRRLRKMFNMLPFELMKREKLPFGQVLAESVYKEAKKEGVKPEEYLDDLFRNEPEEIIKEIRHIIGLEE